MAAEKANATPLGPYGNPMTYAMITSGARTRAIFRLRFSNPSDASNHHIGSINAKTNIVGANNRKIGIASIHFGPRKRKIMSSAKRAQVIVIGKVSDRTIE